jgi:hypothetical protein
MQKYLLYRKGVRMADIDQDDVKPGAQRALSDWIERSRLLFDETEEREAFTFRFVEMRGYREGYEGSCYWISFWAHHPYLKKDGHYPRRTHFDLWVYWNQNRWNVLPFKKSTLDDDFLILLQSWKREEKPHLIPLLKEREKNQDTTADEKHMYVWGQPSLMRKLNISMRTRMATRSTSQPERYKYGSWLRMKSSFMRETRSYSPILLLALITWKRSALRWKNITPRYVTLL